MRKRSGSRVPLWRLVAAVAFGMAALFVAGVGAAAASHVDCGQTITQDTTLDSDLIDCPGDGIVVGADNITLDLNGHTIDGSGPCCGSGVVDGAGFPPSGHDDVTIRGGTIQQFAGGITLAFGKNHRVSGIVASGNSDGIQLADAGTLIEDSYLAGNGAGVRISGSGSHLIQRNTIVGNDCGVVVIETNGSNVVAENRIFENSECGLHIAGVFGFGSTEVIDNRLARNGISGINVVDAANIEIAGNAIEHAQVGIRLTDTHGNRIYRNSVSHNAIGMQLATEASENEISRNAIAANEQSGISMLGGPFSGSDNNDFVDNGLLRNGEDGIFIGDENFGNLFVSNIAHRNGDDGIDVDAPMNTLTRNVANSNGDLGIEAVPGVIDGGGNHAAGNGNPLQCLYVAC
jgi:parallel beta-helix repeat protein